MLKPYRIWTQYQTLILYAVSSDVLQSMISQKIVKVKPCNTWLDSCIRFLQYYFIPIRIRKFEYIHLLETIGQSHVTVRFTDQLSNILTNRHTRYFRYQFCHFLHRLKLGEPLPVSFSKSFDTLTAHMSLLKHPILQTKLSEITPYIIEVLDKQVNTKMRIYSTLTAGLVALSIINASAYILCNTEFVKMHYVKSYFEEYIHPLSRAFMYTFQSSNPSLFNLKLIMICIGVFVLTQMTRTKLIKQFVDPIKLHIPFLGKIIQYRDAQQTVFAILLCQKLSLDYNTTASLCYEQISNDQLKKQWYSIQHNTMTPMYINVLFNKTFASSSLNMTSSTQQHIMQTLKLVKEEILRRENNLLIFVVLLTSATIVLLLLWMLMAYYGYSDSLRIFRF